MPPSVLSENVNFSLVAPGSPDLQQAVESLDLGWPLPTTLRQREIGVSIQRRLAAHGQCLLLCLAMAKKDVPDAWQEFEAVLRSSDWDLAGQMAALGVHVGEHLVGYPEELAEAWFKVAHQAYLEARGKIS
jgi:hypothetical protein